MDISRIIKEELGNLDWVTKSGKEKMPKGPIEYEGREWELIRTLEGVNDQPLYCDTLSGILSFQPNSDYGVVIYCTPHHDVFGKAPIDIEFIDSDGDVDVISLGDINIPIFEYENDVLYFYDKVFLELVKNKIKDSIDNKHIHMVKDFLNG